MKSKIKVPGQFIDAYPTSSFSVINPENFDLFLIREIILSFAWIYQVVCLAGGLLLGGVFSYLLDFV